jgi:hypothetical protein
MKNNKSLIQIFIIVLTFSVIVFIIWGVGTGRLLDNKETKKQMIDGMINKIK